MDAMLPTQPESYRQLIKRSLLLYGAGFIKVIPFAVLLSLVVFTPRLLAILTGQDFLIPVQTFSWQNLWLVLIDIASMLFFIAIVWHMHCVVINKHEPLMEDMAIGVKKVILVFIAAMIQSSIYLAVTCMMLGMQLFLAQYQEWILSSSLGLFLVWLLFTAQFFIIVYIATLFIFLVPIIAIENKGIFSALKRSVLLVWNHWWRTISVQLTPWFCYFFTLLIIRFLLGADIGIYFVAEGSDKLGIIVLHLCLFALYVPWVASLLIVQLKDLELRNKMVLTNE